MSNLNEYKKMSIYTLIAKNYLLSNRQHSISVMIKICILSLTIAVAALTTSIFIMDGFEVATKKNLKSFNPEIIIQPFGKAINYSKLAPILEKEFVNEIESFSPISNQYALLKRNDEIDLNNILIIRGIDPEKEDATTDIEKFIIKGFERHNLSNLLTTNQVIIGKKLAQINSLEIGDKIELVFAHAQKNDIKLEPVQARVSGTISTGIDDVDSSIVICSLNFLKANLPQSVINQINIKPTKNTIKKELTEKLKDRLMIDAFCWEDLYPALVATLKLEKYVAFIVLSLLIIIAAMNLISLIFMFINQKRKDIAILYTLGMKIKSIKTIFIFICLFITIIATLMGLGVATGIGLYLQKNPIQLPDAYYISNLPVEINFVIILAIFLLSITVALTASYIAIRDIKKNKIIGNLK